MNHLRKLAELYGIETNYFDIWGHQIEVEDEVIYHILRTFGEDHFDDTHLEKSILRKQKELSFPIPPVIVTSNCLLVFSPEPEWRSAHMILIGEDGETVERNWSGTGELRLTLPPDFKWGYYRLNLDIQTNTKSLIFDSLLIFTPGYCYLPADKTRWGLNLAVYSLQTSRNQGIGDLQDLEMVQDMLEKQGGSFLGILPLHLIENRLPNGISPYYPLDRMEWNPIYLPLDWVVQFLGIPDGTLFLQRHISELEVIRQEKLLDYQKIWSLKDHILRNLYKTWFENQAGTVPSSWKEFEVFSKREGDRLLHSAFFQAYAALHGWNYQSWPEEYRTGKACAIDRFILENRQEVYYYVFLQWLMNECLSHLSQSQRMIAFDLPVGTSPTGIETWLNQDLFAFSQRVGAPPDDFSPTGQDWGFPPVNPWRDRESYYSHFISLIRENMKYSSYFRIDHIMGLYRLFWIPKGVDVRRGTYVRSFFHDLLGIIALESQRSRVTVIGEDLGTVPPQVREAMKKYRILSTRVLYFENDHEGFLRSPKDFPREAMVTIGTHDMPPLKAFIQGEDIKLREKLGLFTQEAAVKHRQNRVEGINKMKTKLQQWGYLIDELNPTALLKALFRYLASTPSLLKVINLDDLFESDIQLNLPGTTTEYPNWRHQLQCEPTDLESKIQWLAQFFAFQRNEDENQSTDFINL